MDYIEITYHDYLAQNANYIAFDNWFTHDWINQLLSYYNYDKKNPLPIRDTNFSVNDDHIEIYDSWYEVEPYTEIVPNVEGRLTTLWMGTTIQINNSKIKGKMCIRNKSDPPLHTEFELSVENAQMKILIGLSIDNKDCYDGDYFEFDNSVYTVTSENVFFTYKVNSKIVSIFDKIADTSQKKLLKQYLLEYITKDIYDAVLIFKEERLGIKTSVSDQVGADYCLRNVLRIHNRKLHTAFKNLAMEIINLTNIMIQKTSMKVQLKKLFGLISLPKDEKKIEIYQGFISNLHSLKIVNDKYVIVSNKNDLTILHIPVEFDHLNINYKDIRDDKTKETNNDIFNVQSYAVEEAYFVISLKKLDPSKVEFNLMDFKIKNFKCKTKVQILLIMDYLITHAIEESMKPCITEVLKNESLNYLAINPPVEIEYYGNEFNTEESDDSQLEDDPNVNE